MCMTERQVNTQIPAHFWLAYNAEDVGTEKTVDGLTIAHMLRQDLFLCRMRGMSQCLGLWPAVIGRFNEISCY